MNEEGSEPGQVYDLGAYRERRQRGEASNPLPPLEDIFTTSITPERIEREVREVVSDITADPDTRPGALALYLFEAFDIVNPRLDLFEAQWKLRDAVGQERVERLIDIEHSLKYAVTVLDKWESEGGKYSARKLSELQFLLGQYPEVQNCSLMNAVDLLLKELPDNPLALTVHRLILLVLDDHVEDDTF